MLKKDDNYCASKCKYIRDIEVAYICELFDKNLSCIRIDGFRSTKYRAIRCNDCLEFSKLFK